MNEAKQLQRSLGVDFTKVDEAADIQKIIKALINTKFSGSNEEQGKAVQLLRGLAFSDDPASDKFMKALDNFTSGLKAEDFTEARLGEGAGDKVNV
ncbi:hypothetical protein LCGC14_2702470, partial [marine sediment metagenome]